MTQEHEDSSALADAYFHQKAEEYASILEWAKKEIAFTPSGKIVRPMEDNGSEPPTEVWGVSSEPFVNTGKNTCIHVTKALYDVCESPHKDDPNYWLAHMRAGNPNMDSHDADEEM